ncbi:MAG TPA: glycosyltransferase family 4 protein [Bryobacteraceae bacterium]|nr:glycosyltransferase family 4 protein [Bryobacteraceae bacterium]
MSSWKGRLRSLLRRAAEGKERVATVFGVDATSCSRAVQHLRAGAPDVPIWLCTTAAPFPETEALCERVFRNPNGLALVAGAQIQLRKRWVAISVGAWGYQGTSGGAWALKVAPFLTPPFRVLILNKDGGFFSGTPGNIAVYCLRAWSDSMRRAWARTREAIHSARVALRDARVRGGERIYWARVHAQDRVRQATVKWRDLSHGLSKLAKATGLRTLSTLLRWTANPHRGWFRKLHGSLPLMLDAPAPEGCDVVRFVQQGNDWDGERLEQLARSSRARWVLWQRAGQTDELYDAAPLFKDDRTFVVSRQAHFRGWKPFLAPTAPFRTMQANEASRVLAPIANTMLVDRSKLLALGIPRCELAGTAWLILFWKAAAAGFRSYSVGQAEALREQPEAPIQETEFFLRALADPALRVLCPRQEELSRGNIAFAPAFLRPSPEDSERLKVLIVSPFLPYPLSHGGAVRIFNLCRELSGRVDFSLIAMREARDEVNYAKLHEVFREVHVVDKDVRTSPDKRLPEQVSASESASLRALVEQLSQKLLPHLIQFEYTHFAGLRDSAPGVPAILVEHDLTFSLYHQLAEAKDTPEAWREYQRWMSFERQWLSAYEGAWTVSEDDRIKAVETGRRAAESTFCIPNGVDIERFQPADAEQHREIFYVGSFRHLPNIIGFEKLCQEVMPRVWKKHPDARLCVVAGPDHKFFWKEFGRNGDPGSIDKRIEMHGFVEDLRPLYARAAVVAVPLEVSAGTNIKVLEAMACGKAIVSTPVGCAGLGVRDGQQLLVRQDWGDFSDAICRVLESEALRTGLSGNARIAAEESFSWSAIAERAYESYLTLAGLSAPAPSAVEAEPQVRETVRR